MRILIIIRKKLDELKKDGEELKFLKESGEYLSKVRRNLISSEDIIFD